MSGNSPQAQSKQMGSKLLTGILLLVIIGCVSWMVMQIVGLQHGPRIALIEISKRQEIPAMQWKDLDGGDWTLADHKGRVVVINYFATWCVPCRREIPDLNAIIKEFAGRDVVFVMISVDLQVELNTPLIPTLKAFAAENGLTIPVLLSRAAPGTTESRSVPTTILVDRRGRMAEAIEGRFEADELRRDLNLLLEEK